MTRTFSLLTLMTGLLTVPLTGEAAGFGINATRLIYPEGASSISVTVRNTLSHEPYLVQASISGQQEHKTAAPFSVTPPLFRLEPQSINQLRIAFTGQPLPADRESVFYFHTVAIPTSSQANNGQGQQDIKAQLSFGVGNIIKLFYRPAGLGISSADARKGLQFSSESNGLKVTNPSPYFVNLAELQVGSQKLKLDTPASRMLAPFGNHTWPVKASDLAPGKKVQWQAINDTGGADAFSAGLP
ncbi:molecular chaperone [Enterobacter sp. CC120223-11]|uniref:fimbrial biogenesis chaperone n=1 Tax=Enterobacter sp. CC120223-11 TaxID=1378073 RepID=UPI000BCCD55C|nr:molecular chaperone [Enterobacter sp. CC120223-11]SNY79862.1 fimbrial chaperone protein [Enterobacter sp. CC120223-11]